MIRLRLKVNFLLFSMESQILHDINHLTRLLQLSTPDSLKIAEAVLERNNEIDIPELPQLRQAVYRSLSEKKNWQLSQEVREIKIKIIASLAQTQKSRTEDGVHSLA